MTREKQPRTLADIMLGLEQKIEEAQKENAQATATIRKEPRVTLDSLNQDAGYFKIAIYGLGAAIVWLIITGWQLYLHLDDKIDHKMDYMNGRIDGLFLLQRAEAHNVALTPTMSPTGTPPVKPANDTKAETQKKHHHRSFD